MALSTASANLSFLSSKVADLVIRPVTEESTATQVSTVVSTDAAVYRIPLVTGDASAAWTPENSEIAPSDPTLGEIVVGFKALKGLTILSNELFADSSPEASGIIGDSIARDLAQKIDAAFWVAGVLNAPPGIKSVTPTITSAGGNWDDLDPFITALYQAEGLGAHIDTWVANPADAIALSTLKVQIGSAQNLLSPDPSAAGNRSLAGVPLLADAAVPLGEVYGIPKKFTYVILRSAASVEIDGSPYFSSDRTAIRTVLRIGFAFTHPLAIQRVTKA